MKIHTNGTNPAAPALDRTLVDLRRRFGPDVIRPASELPPVEIIPTGFPALDRALIIGGLPRGRIVNIYGPDSSGKTTLCLHVIAEAQNAGGQAAFIDAEHKLDPAWAARRGVDVDRLMVIHPETGERALEMAAALTRSGALSVIVVDSTAALLPRAEADSEMGDMHNHHGALMAQALRKLAGLAYRTNTLLIFTSQLRFKIGAMFGPSEAITGGSALRYYAAVALDLRRQQVIKRHGDVIGSRVRAVIKKNQLAPAYRQAEFDIYFEAS